VSERSAAFTPLPLGTLSAELRTFLSGGKGARWSGLKAALLAPLGGGVLNRDQSWTLRGVGKGRRMGPFRRSAKYSSAIRQIENSRLPRCPARALSFVVEIEVMNGGSSEYQEWQTGAAQPWFAARKRWGGTARRASPICTNLLQKAYRVLAIPDSLSFRCCPCGDGCFEGVLVRCRKLLNCNRTIQHRLRLDDYECSNLEYSMDRLRPESTTRSWRPEFLLRHGAQTARAALSFMRFDHLQPSPQVMRCLRPGVAGGLPVHSDGGRDGGNAAEVRARAA